MGELAYSLVFTVNEYECKRMYNVGINKTKPRKTRKQMRGIKIYSNSLVKTKARCMYQHKIPKDKGFESVKGMGILCIGQPMLTSQTLP